MAEKQAVKNPEEAQAEDLYTRQIARFVADAENDLEQAIHRYGFTLWHSLDPDSATDFAAHLGIGNESPNELYNRGTKAARDGEFAKAEAVFRAALDKDPDHGLAAFNRAVCLEKLGRLKEARKAYEQYLEILDRASLRTDLLAGAEGDIAEEKVRVQRRIDNLRKK